MVYQENKIFNDKNIKTCRFYLQLLHLVIYNLKHDMRGRPWKVGGGRGGKRHQTSD